MSEIGLDIVEVVRVKRAICKYGDKFINRIYTPAEIKYCKEKVNPYTHFTGRFAAKEAILKALPEGWQGKLKWTDIEIKNNSTGNPRIILKGTALKFCHRKKIKKIKITISHEKNYAVALAMV
ncbi:MAG: holo-ACP synthase [Candidatus Firestonebacteria bacterium]